MLKPLFDQLAHVVDGEQSIRYAERNMSTDRWFTYPAYRKTAEFCAEELRRQSLEVVNIVALESTGGWGLAGWLLPRAWDCQRASLDVISPVNYEVANYAQQPISLVQHSAATPTEGAEAELVVFDEDRARRGELAGKVVFTHHSVTAIQEEVAHAGALGIVSDFIDEFPGVRTREDLPNAHRWVNDAFKPDNVAGLFGFSLNHPQGRRLAKLLDQHPEVRVRARIDSQIYDDSIGVVTGLIPGQTDQEVLVLGHLYEVGALDNASGSGLILELARALAQLKHSGQVASPLRRGIRFLFTFEMYGTFGFFEKLGPARTQRIVAGLNLDALGGNQERVGCPISLLRTPHSLPSYTNTLMRRILSLHAAEPDAKATREAPFFETIGGDNMCADPAIGVQCPTFWQHPSRHWHTSADTLDTLDPQQLQQLGRAALTYLIFVANADAAEVAWLAGEVERDGRQVLSQCQDRAEWEHHREITRRALDSLAVLSPGRRVKAVGQAQQRIELLRPDAGLTALHPSDDQVALLRPYLARRTTIGVPSTHRIIEMLPLEESIAAKPLMARVTDNYLSALLYWCDGQRTLAEAYRLTELEARELRAFWSGNASDMMTHELAVRAGRWVAPADVLTAFEIMANLNLVEVEVKKQRHHANRSSGLA